MKSSKIFQEAISNVSPKIKAEVRRNIEVCDALAKAGTDMLHHYYEVVCDTYKQRLCEQLEVTDAYWMRDEVGCCLDINGYYVIDMPEIVLLVDNCIGYDEFDEWYCQWADMDREHRINLRSWIMGARPEMFND